MKKRVVSLLLCLIMALSLIPTVAFAAEVNTPTTDAEKTTNGAYANNGWSAGGTGSVTTEDGLTLSKTAKATDNDNEYTITLEVKTSQTTTTTTTPGNAATVLVIDTSGSMAWCTKNHRHTDDCYTTTLCTKDTNPSHWGSWTDLWRTHYYHKWEYSCYYNWKDGEYYQVSDTCGQAQHNHHNATGGEWCNSPGLTSDTHSRIAYAKAAAKTFLDSYKDTSSTPAARWVAIVSFNNYASSAPWYNVSTSDGYNNAVNAIDALTADGGTNLDAGLVKAKELMSNDIVKDILKDNKNVVALTDGAPTKSQTYGIGNYGSENINTETENTATALKKDITGLYTICFAASGEVCYQGGPSVGDFLKDSIASTGKNSTVDEGADLPTKFETISNTITSGLTGEGGWTVTDPMADNISVVDGSTSPEFVLTDASSKTYTWTLTNATQTPNGNTTTYTYTTSYKVKIDSTATGLQENTFYPTNKVTTLNYTNANGNPATAYFPVPGVKVKLSDPTPSANVTANIYIEKRIDVSTGSRQPDPTTFTFKAYYVGKDSKEMPIPKGEFSIKYNGTGSSITGNWTLNIPKNIFDANNNENIKVLIKEVNSNVPGWTYSNAVYTLHIDLAGNVSVPTVNDEWIPHNEKNRLMFANTYTYTPPARPSDPIRRQPTTTTTKPVKSVKTGDMGIALYAVTSLLSLSGTALLIKKRKDEK